MLQYRTAGDERVRSAHQSLHNTTLPKNDPFWQSFTPPNGWRCRCTVVQVNADKYTKTDPAQAKKHGEQATFTPNKNGVNTSAIFRFNPATDKIVFPKNHPYSRVKDSDKAISLLTKDTKIDNGKMKVKQIKKYDNGGTLSEHTLLKDKKYRDSDYKNVSIVANTFAKHGHQATIMPTIQPDDKKYKEVYHQLVGTKYEGKSPDFIINGNFYEYKSVHEFNANTLSRIIRNAEKQSSHIIIDKLPIANSEIVKVSKYLNEQKKDIQEVWTYDKENKTVTQVFKKQKH